MQPFARAGGRDAATRRAREQLIWRFRLGAVVLTSFQTAVEPGDSAAVSWILVGLFWVSVLASERVLTRDPSDRAVRRVGIAVTVVDVAVVGTLLANNLTDPAEPIYLVSVLALLEVTMRWPRYGGAVGGLVAGLAAGIWTVVAYHRAGVAPEYSYASMRAGVLVVLGVFFGALTHRLSEQHRALQRVLDSSRDLIVTLDPSGVVLGVNAACESMLGWRAQDVIGRDCRDFLDKDQSVDLADSSILARVEPGAPPLLALRRFRCADGGTKWVELSVSADPGAGTIHLTGRDVTERLESERQVSTSEQRFRSLFDHNADAVYSFDREGRFTSANPATEGLTGYGAEELCDLTFHELIAPEHRSRTAQRFRQALAGESQTYDTVVLARDGSRIDLDVTNMPIVVDDEVVGVFGVAKDVTGRRRLERELSHQATHDSLTELPNRAYLEELLGVVMSAPRPAPAALLFVDLDRFKVVNDSLGHRCGDELLVAVAGRLDACLRGDDLLVRWAGDEFCVLLEGRAGEAEARRIADRLLGALAEPFAIDGRDVRLSASIGVAQSRPGDAPERLVQMADTAMYEAKRAGRNRYVVHEPHRSSLASNPIDIENQLHRAIQTGALHLDYQPIVEVTTGRIVAVESLVRWIDDSGTVRLPDDFIHVAEDSGLIRPLTRWVLGEATRQLADWERSIPTASEVCMWVNVSGVDLQDPQFVADVVDALQDASVAPERLVLEITESTLLLDLEQVDRTVDALGRLGVSLAIDDFGTGYSSMTRLHRLQVAACKIDRSFVAGAPGSERDAAIIRSLADLGDAFGFRVVGEGVETLEQLEVLRASGCGLAQGYLLARPGAAPALEACLRAGRVDTGFLVH